MCEIEFVLDISFKSLSVRDLKRSNKSWFFLNPERATWRILEWSIWWAHKSKSGDFKCRGWKYSSWPRYGHSHL